MSDNDLTNFSSSVGTGDLDNYSSSVDLGSLETNYSSSISKSLDVQIETNRKATDVRNASIKKEGILTDFTLPTEDVWKKANPGYTQDQLTEFRKQKLEEAVQHVYADNIRKQTGVGGLESEFQFLSDPALDVLKGGIGLAETGYGFVDVGTRLATGPVERAFSGLGIDLDLPSLDEVLGISPAFGRAREFYDDKQSGGRQLQKQESQLKDAYFDIRSADRIQEDINKGSSELGALIREEGRGILQKARDLKDDPGIIMGGSIESIPNFFGIGLAGKAGAKMLLRKELGEKADDAGAYAEWISDKDNQKKLEKAAGRYGLAYVGASEGLSNGYQAKSQILELSDAEVEKLPDYKELKAKGLSTAEIREQVADDVFNITASTSAVLATLAGKGTGIGEFFGKMALKIPTKDITATVASRIRAGSLGKGPEGFIREFVEEAGQSAAGVFAENLATGLKVDTDDFTLAKTVKGTGRAGTEGAIIGGLSGGAIGAGSGSITDLESAGILAAEGTKRAKESFQKVEMDPNNPEYNATKAFKAAFKEADHDKIGTSEYDETLETIQGHANLAKKDMEDALEVAKKAFIASNEDPENIELKKAEEDAAIAYAQAKAAYNETNEQFQAFQQIHKNAKIKEETGFDPSEDPAGKVKDPNTPAAVAEQAASNLMQSGPGKDPFNSKNEEALTDIVNNENISESRRKAAKAILDAIKAGKRKHPGTGKTIGEVHNEVLYGSDKNYGYANHYNDIEIAVQSGDTESAQAQLNYLNRFVSSQVTKAQLIDTAFNEAKNGREGSEAHTQAINSLNKLFPRPRGSKPWNIHKGSGKIHAQTQYEAEAGKSTLRAAMSISGLKPESVTGRDAASQVLQEETTQTAEPVTETSTEEATTEPSGVTLTGKSEFVEKDQKKADQANKFIGQGSEQSSTEQYRKDFGDKANTGEYTANDKVFVSVEGNRKGRQSFNREEVDKAIKAGATIIADDPSNRKRDYNVGERELAQYLLDNGYKENRKDGYSEWTKPTPTSEAQASPQRQQAAETEAAADTQQTPRKFITQQLNKGESLDSLEERIKKSSSKKKDEMLKRITDIRKLVGPADNIRDAASKQSTLTSSGIDAHVVKNADGTFEVRLGKSSTITEKQSIIPSEKLDDLAEEYTVEQLREEARREAKRQGDNESLSTEEEAVTRTTPPKYAYNDIKRQYLRAQVNNQLGGKTPIEYMEEQLADPDSEVDKEFLRDAINFTKGFQESYRTLYPNANLGRVNPEIGFSRSAPYKMLMVEQPDGKYNFRNETIEQLGLAAFMWLIEDGKQSTHLTEKDIKSFLGKDKNARLTAGEWEIAELGIPVTRAAESLGGYWAKISGVKAYETVDERNKDQGIDGRTPLGRKPIYGGLQNNINTQMGGLAFDILHSPYMSDMVSFSRPTGDIIAVEEQRLDEDAGTKLSAQKALYDRQSLFIKAKTNSNGDAVPFISKNFNRSIARKNSEVLETILRERKRSAVPSPHVPKNLEKEGSINNSTQEASDKELENVNKHNKLKHKWKRGAAEQLEFLTRGLETDENGSVIYKDGIRPLLGYVYPEDLENMHYLQRRAAETRNKEIDTEIDLAVNFLKDVRTWPEGLDSPFYFENFINTNRRVQQRGRTSPQSSKFFRHLFEVDGWDTNVDTRNQGQMDMFALAVLEGLGAKIAKQDLARTREQFASILEQPLNNEEALTYFDAINVINYMTGKGESYFNEMMQVNSEAEAIVVMEQMEEILDLAVSKGGEKYWSMDSLFALADYHNAQAQNQKVFYTNLPREVDGITNGVILGIMQLGGGESFAQMFQQLNKGGIFGKDGHNSYNDYATTQGNMDKNDLYETLALSVDRGLRSLAEEAQLTVAHYEQNRPTIPQQWGEFFTAQRSAKSVPAIKELIAFVADVDLSQDDNLFSQLDKDDFYEDADGNVHYVLRATKQARNLSKSPLMTVSYGSGMASINFNLSEEILQDIFDKMVDVQNSMNNATTKEEKKRYRDQLVNAERQLMVLTDSNTREDLWHRQTFNNQGKIDFKQARLSETPRVRLGRNTDPLSSKELYLRSFEVSYGNSLEQGIREMLPRMMSNRAALNAVVSYSYQVMLGRLKVLVRNAERAKVGLPPLIEGIEQEPEAERKQGIPLSEKEIFELVDQLQGVSPIMKTFFSDVLKEGILLTRARNMRRSDFLGDDKDPIGGLQNKLNMRLSQGFNTTGKDESTFYNGQPVAIMADNQLGIRTKNGIKPLVINGQQAYFVPSQGTITQSDQKTPIKVKQGNKTVNASLQTKKGKAIKGLVRHMEHKDGEIRPTLVSAENYTRQFSMMPKEVIMEDPGVSGGVMLVQHIDAAIMHSLLGSEQILNIYDAAMMKVTQTADISNKLNKATVDVSKQYSMMEAAFELLQRLADETTEEERRTSYTITEGEARMGLYQNDWDKVTTLFFGDALSRNGGAWADSQQVRDVVLPWIARSGQYDGTILESVYEVMPEIKEELPANPTEEQLIEALNKYVFQDSVQTQANTPNRAPDTPVYKKGTPLQYIPGSDGLSGRPVRFSTGQIAYFVYTGHPSQATLFSPSGEALRPILYASQDPDQQVAQINSVIEGQYPNDIKQGDVFQSEGVALDKTAFIGAEVRQENSTTTLSTFNSLANEGIVKETKEHSDYLYKLLDTVVNRVIAPFETHLADYGHENIGEADVDKRIIRVQRAMHRSRKWTAGAVKSAQEVYAHEVSHLVVGYGIMTSDYVSRQLDRLIDIVEKDPSITPKIFLEMDGNQIVLPNGQRLDPHKDKIAYAEAMKEAEDQYNYIFSNKQEFAAYGLTNARFIKALRNIVVDRQKLAEEKSNNVFVKLKQLFDKLTAEIFGKIKNQGTVTADMALIEMVDSLSKHQQQTEATNIAFMEKLNTGTNNVITNWVIGPIQRWGGKERQLSERAQKPANEKNPVENIASAVELTIDAIRRGSKTDVDSWIKTLEKTTKNNQELLNGLQIIMNELIGTTKEGHKEYEHHRRQVTRLIEQTRIRLTKSMTEQFIKEFEKELGREPNKQERIAITQAVLMTDLESIYFTPGKGDSFAPVYSIQDLAKLLSDDNYRKNEIAKIEGRITREFTGKEQNNAFHYIKQARSLGSFMARKILTEWGGFSLNAHTIARGDNNPGVNEPKNLQKATDLVNVLATLHAIGYTNSQSRDQVANLLREAPNAMDFTIRTHGGIKKQALKTNFNNDPTHMQKGYTYESFNSRVGYEVLPADQGAELLRKGWRQSDKPIIPDPNDPNKDTVMYAYWHPLGGKPQLDATGISWTNHNHSGVDLLNRHLTLGTPNPVLEAHLDVLQWEKDQNAAALATLTAADTSVEGANIMVPINDLNGNITNARYIMKEKTRRNILQKEEDFTHVLGSMEGNIVDKAMTPALNRRAVELMKEEFDKDYTSNPAAYIKLHAKATDPRIREVWNMLPEDMKEDIGNIWGANHMYVHEDAWLQLFGQRKLSISSIQYIDKTGLRSMNKIKATANNMLYEMLTKHPKIFNGGLYLEAGWQNFVTYAKDTIVIKSIHVLKNNIISNQLNLLLLGLDPVQMFKDQMIAFRAAKEYQRLEIERDVLKRTMRGMSRPVTAAEKKEHRDMLNKIRRLEKSMEQNEVHVLMKHGAYQSVNEDVYTADPTGPVTGVLDRLVERVDEKIPLKVRKPLNIITMRHGTPVYEGLRDLTQLSDFMARYAMFKHQERHLKKQLRSLGLPMTVDHEKKLIDQIMETFIDYDMPTAPWLQYGNDGGFVMFTKYWIRNQRIIARMGKDRPGSVAILLALQGITGVGFPDIFDATFLNPVGVNSFADTASAAFTNHPAWYLTADLL